MVRGVGRAVAGLALLFAVTACDDNPLAEDRDRSAYFRLNPVNVAVEAGGTVLVNAVLVNKYGAGTNEAVSAQPCDGMISVAKDPNRGPYEFPERFVVTGITYGTTCLIVTGGALTDTVNIRVVPAMLDLTLPAGADTMEAGETVTLPLAYLGRTGAPVPGLALDAATTFTVVTAGIGVVNTQGQFSARSPGTTWVRSTWTGLGVTRRDSVQINVTPASFTGTATQVAFGGGQVIEFAGGHIPFDADTRVEFPGVAGGNFVHLLPVSTMRAAILPGTPAGTTIPYFIFNAGPDNLTVAGSFTTTAAAPTTDAFNNIDPASARPLTPGEDAFGLITGVRFAEEWFVVTITEAGTYRFEFRWNDTLDKDLYVLDSALTVLAAQENVAATNPEVATLALTPGTYYLIGSTWTPNPGADVYFRARVTKQ